MSKRICLIVAILVIALSGCQPTPSDQQTQTALAQTELTASTETPIPTAEPTITPTNTPFPIPTETLFTNDTQVPDPISYQGTGDSIVEIDGYDWRWGLIYIKGNESGNRFSVTSFNEKSYQELLVDTTNPYEGVRLLDSRSNYHTTRLEIEAIGDWEFTIYPPDESSFYTLGSVLPSSGSFAGRGDNVIYLESETAEHAKIEGNSNSTLFTALAMGTSGRNMLVNSTVPVRDTFDLEYRTFLLAITAEGEWTIEIMD